jgi:hypothetical protein
LRNETVRLMKDHFIHRLPLAVKFDDEALQLDDAEPSFLLGRKAIGRLIIGLQRKPAFQVSVDGTSLGLRLVKKAIPMPKSGRSVIRVPQPGQPPP